MSINSQGENAKGCGKCRTNRKSRPRAHLQPDTTRNSSAYTDALCTRRPPPPPNPHRRWYHPYLRAGFAGAGVFALRGSLDGVVAACAGSFLIGFPLKFLVSYAIIYHWLGGLRHIVWDVSKIGNQADRTSLLELPKVEMSSKVLLGASAALALIAAVL